MWNDREDRVGDPIRQTLLDRFAAYLDSIDLDDPAETPDEAGASTDLYSLFVELAGLRGEVRTESRLVKDALDQFRGAFTLLESNNAQLRQELERARAETREREAALLRPLLLDVIDLRDRLQAALKYSAGAPPSRWARIFGRAPGDDESWKDGLRMTLRRLDQMLLDRRVVATQLVGKPFDPHRARVVAVAEDSAAPPGTVTEEVRAGFLWDEKILRIAEVIVSKRAPAAPATDESGERT